MAEGIDQGLNPVVTIVGDDALPALSLGSGRDPDELDPVGHDADGPDLACGLVDHIVVDLVVADVWVVLVVHTLEVVDVEDMLVVGDGELGPLPGGREEGRHGKACSTDPTEQAVGGVGHGVEVGVGVKAGGHVMRPLGESDGCARGGT